MDRVGRPRGLIRYASLNSIERGEKFKVTPRMIGYVVVLCLLVAGLTFLVFTRTEVQTTLLRAPGALFQQTLEGRIENIYTLKLVNKTSRDIPVQLKLESAQGRLTVMGGRNLVVPSEQLTQTSVLIEMPPTALHGSNTKLSIGVYSNGKLVEKLKTVFIGPRDDSIKKP
jgi:polyferredoxin